MLRRALGALDDLRGGHALEGLLAAVLLYGLYQTWLWLFGAEGPLGPLEGPNRLNTVVILLLAFLWATTRYYVREDPRDLATLRPRTRLSEAELERVLAGLTAFEPGRLAALMIATGGLGVLIVPATQENPLFFLDLGRVDGTFTWALLANALLFSFLGMGIYSATLSRRVIARMAHALESIDLLDLSSLAPFSRIALRHSVLWLGGSAIASLILLDLDVVWPVLAIIAGTVGVATHAFLDPMRAVHQRIREAKYAELARVRERITKARNAAVERSEPGAAAELEGLLAWERRVGELHEWPFDVSTLARFSALLVLAVGSWLGGAVVERVLGVVLGG